MKAVRPEECSAGAGLTCRGNSFQSSGAMTAKVRSPLCSFIIQVTTIVNIITYYVFLFFVLVPLYTYFCCMIEGTNGHIVLYNYTLYDTWQLKLECEPKATGLRTWVTLLKCEVVKGQRDKLELAHLGGQVTLSPQWICSHFHFPVSWVILKLKQRQTEMKELWKYVWKNCVPPKIRLSVTLLNSFTFIWASFHYSQCLKWINEGENKISVTLFV